MGIQANDRTKNSRVHEVLAKFDLDISAVWNCHGTPVIYHWACERIGAKMGVKFDAPTLIDQNTGQKVITILVTGHYGERSEWAFGEVTPNNCKNAYPWAMAEKRAKDRVILKLANLSGEVYSEEESDDFKRPTPAERTEPRASVQTEDALDWDDLIDCPSGVKPRNASQSREPFALLRDCIAAAVAPEDLEEWAKANAGEIYQLSKEARHHLRDAYNERMENLIIERSAM